MAYIKVMFKQKERPKERRQEAKDLGVLGEQMAAKYLEDKGCVIIERNYRNRHREVDIVCLDGADLVFVEVKTRTSDTFIPPIAAVNHQKRQNIIRVANQYVCYYKRRENVRFDIITIVTGGATPKIEHVRNAFNVMIY